MKNIQSFLNGKRVKSAFRTTMKNGKTRFEQKKYDAFCAEKLAIASRAR